MTSDEIERILRRGGLSEEQQARLWDCLFLTSQQVEEVLDHVKETAKHPFIYPMFVLVAHTGARRSELLRSRVEDFDFDSRTC